MLKFRTKIEIMLVCFFVAMLSVSNVLSVDQEFGVSPTTGETLAGITSRAIVNSNGKAWDATNANLKLAINDTSSGGWIEIPGNTTIEISSVASLSGMRDITLRGNGKSSKLVLANNADVHILRVDGGQNITIEKIFFDGNSKNQGSHSALINLTDRGGTSVRNVTIRECWFNNSNHTFIDCHDFDSGKEAVIDNIIVDNCRFVGIKNHSGSPWSSGVFLGGDNNHITNNFFRDTWGPAIACEDTDTSNYDGCNQNIITENTIVGNCSIGIYLEGRGSLDIPKSMWDIVSDNIIDSIGNSYYYGISNFNAIGILAMSGCIISNNIIKNLTYGTRQRGIYCSGYDNNATGIGLIITGNIIDGLDTTNNDDAGIWVVNTSCIISDNIINNTGCNAIHVDVYDDTGSEVYICNVHDNIITNVGDDGILCSMSGSLHHNIIQDVTDDGIQIVGQANVTIEYNKFKDITDNGVYAEHQCDVIGNEFLNTDDTAIFMNIGADQHIARVNGNKIVDSASYGIYLINAAFVTCNSNTIYEVALDGIRLSSCTNMTCNSNTIFDTSTNNDGIEILNSYHFSVNGNTIWGFDDCIDTSTGSSGYIICGNTLRGYGTNPVNQGGAIYKIVGNLNEADSSNP